MSRRYCTGCGAKLSENAHFCGSCGKPAHQTATVATPEAMVNVPLPSGGTDPNVNPPASTAGPRTAMILVFLALLAGETVRDMGSANPSEAVAFRIGWGMAPALVSVAILATFLLAVAAVYWASAWQRGVRFAYALFNWPMVLAAALIASLVVLA